MGIGDDTAVLAPPKDNLLTTVDMQVEGVHFDLAYCEFEDVGHKALAVNLSDVAAMGGTPLYALVSLGVRDGLPDGWERKLYQGIGALAKHHGVDIVGVNISRAKEFVIDIAVIGEATKPVLRSGAKIGQQIGVTGPLGNSAAGLAWLRSGGAGLKFPVATQKHLRPRPLIEAGRTLIKNGAVSALIDISDGLSSECHHLAAASKVELSLVEKDIPVATEAKSIARELQLSADEWALHGGEEYELLFTFDPERGRQVSEVLSAVGCALYVVGTVKKGRGVTITKEGGTEPLAARGWDHLSPI